MKHEQSKQSYRWVSVARGDVGERRQQLLILRCGGEAGAVLRSKVAAEATEAAPRARVNRRLLSILLLLIIVVVIAVVIAVWIRVFAVIISVFCATSATELRRGRRDERGGQLRRRSPQRGRRGGQAGGEHGQHAAAEAGLQQPRRPHTARQQAPAQHNQRARTACSLPRTLREKRERLASD